MHGCWVCQQQKDLTSAPGGLLKLIDNPAEYFLVWSMDFIIDLPISGSFNSVLTIVDKLTKWVKLIPMVVGDGELSALSVALFFSITLCIVLGFHMWCYMTGTPDLPCSFWTTLWELLGTRLFLSSTYHPESNG